MPKKIMAEASNKQGVKYELEALPDICPRCHVASNYEMMKTYTNISDDHGCPHDTIQVIFQCPRQQCRSFLIAEYWVPQGYSETYISLMSVYPTTTVIKEFSEIIKATSSKFIQIYNQSLEAENRELTEIAGPGYRRALEFLIKEHIIGKLLANSKEPPHNTIGEVVSETSLQKLINKYYADNPKLKQVAERGWWLGNDLTHYQQKWEGKDVTHFKQIIHMVVNWIEIEADSAKLVEDMPS